MGKRTASKARRRLRASKAAEEAAEAALAELERPPWQCPVVGCDGFGLCRHDTPQGVAYLCARCNEVAERNLREERQRQELMDALVAPLERAARLYAEQNGGRPPLPLHGAPNSQSTGENLLRFQMNCRFGDVVSRLQLTETLAREVEKEPTS